MSDEILESLRELYAGRYWGLVGIETVSAERGRVVNRIALQDHHLNYNHIVHGGVIASLVDSAAGGAVRSLRDPTEIKARPHATSDLHVTYLSPVAGGEIIATARVVKAGRTAIFTEVDVTTGDGKLVARGMVTFVVSAGPPVPPRG